MALWVAVANPMMIIHMVGGGHNDLLVMGLLATGSLFALRGRHVVGIVLVTAAMAVKASAGVALPFLVLVWAAHMSGSQTARITKAAAAGIGVFASVFALITLAARVDLGWLPALSAPSMIVNWMSLPTGVGEFVHWLLEIPFDLPKQPFINVARIIGGIALLVIAVRQWWAARDGGPDAIRRAGIVLLAVAVLSPAMLPWYVSWGMALIAGAPWSRRALSWLVFFSLMLVIVYYPNGEDALYNWLYLAVCAALSALAAVSLHRVDPLHLRLRSPGRTAPPFPTSSRMPGSGAAELDAAGITDPALRAAYATCRALNAAHGRTYFLATRLLPAARRPAVHALYGFARYADEIVDDLGDDRPVAEKAAAAGRADGGPGGGARRCTRRPTPSSPRWPTPPAATTSTGGTSPTSWCRCGWTPRSPSTPPSTTSPSTCTARRR